MFLWLIFLFRSLLLLKHCKLNIFFVCLAYSLDSVGSFGSQSLGPNALGNQTDGKDRPDHHGLEFRLIIDSKSGPPLTLSLVAATPQEKAAWCSEISQVRTTFLFLYLKKQKQKKIPHS